MLQGFDTPSKSWQLPCACLIHKFRFERSYAQGMPGNLSKDVGAEWECVAYAPICTLCKYQQICA